MIKFKNLFSFTQKEIDYAFKNVKGVKKSTGLRLIQAPLLPDVSDKIDLPSQPHGKLLIITPRKTGKAHIRNLLRRRAKAIFYTHKLYQKPVSSILSLYHEAASLSFEQLEAFLLSCFPESK